MDTRLRKLFEDYERAFNALEVDKQAPFFAEHFISGGPKGSIAVGREEFLRMSHQAGHEEPGPDELLALLYRRLPFTDVAAFACIK